MSRNYITILVAVLLAIIAVLGYQLYQTQQKTTGIEINLDSNGLSIEQTKP